MLRVRVRRYVDENTVGLAPHRMMPKEEIAGAWDSLREPMVERPAEQHIATATFSLRSGVGEAQVRFGIVFWPQPRALGECGGEQEDLIPGCPVFSKS